MPRKAFSKTVFRTAGSRRFGFFGKSAREDLRLLHLDFATNVALQQYLAAVAGQRHKIYAYGYEAAANGVYYFSATVGGAVYRFGRRITLGVIVQTLVNPIVCDAGTALNFMSNGGNCYPWIQYVTEV